MLFSLILLIAAFIVYFDMVVPAYSDMQTLKGKQSSENDILAQVLQTEQQVQKLIVAYKNENQAQSAVALSLPSGQDVSGALTQIYGIAQVNNIYLQNITVSGSSLLSNPNAKSASAANVPVAPLVKPLGSISFAASASGSYEDFKNFLSQIETNIRIFDVKNISIQPATQSATSSRNLFNYTLTIVAYYQIL